MSDQLEAERRVRRKIVGLILREWATAKERGNEETARVLDLIATTADELIARELPDHGLARTPVVQSEESA